MLQLALAADLQELYPSQSGVLLLFGFANDGVGTARMKTGIRIGNGVATTAMKEVGECFGCMKQPFR